jgi:predicted DNA-binding transcriptional regulator AlpA
MARLAEQHMPHDHELLTERETAELLRMSTRTLQRLAAQHAGPPKLMLTVRRIAYRRADVLAWIEGRKARQSVA